MWGSRWKHSRKLSDFKPHICFQRKNHLTSCPTAVGFLGSSPQFKENVTYFRPWKNRPGKNMSTPFSLHQLSEPAFKHRTWNRLKWLSVVRMHIVCWNRWVGARCAVPGGMEVPGMCQKVRINAHTIHGTGIFTYIYHILPFKTTKCR